MSERDQGIHCGQEVGIFAEEGVAEEGLVSLAAGWLETARGSAFSPHHPPAQAVHVEVNHRCSKQGECLAQDQSADDGDTERLPQLRSNPGSKR